jgi:CHAD domain-containing protein
MLGMRSPISVLDEEMTSLIGLLPGVRDGSEVAIHDARVATRRIREALTAAEATFDERHFTELRSLTRRAGRALGSVRDADVAHQLLAGLDSRFPLALLVTGRFRASLVEARLVGRRRLIKKLENLGLEAAAKRLTGLPRRGWLGSRDAQGWRDRLRGQIASRAGVLRQAVHHAAGVYFPNRSHSARVATKKLRYSLELADRTGLWHPTRAIRRLKKVQEALGQAHDRQILIEQLRSDGELSTEPTPELRAVIRFLEAEALSLHATYARRRQDLVAICDECEHAVLPARPVHVAVAAGLAVSPLLLLGRRLLSGDAREANAESVPMRVRVAGARRS